MKLNRTLAVFGTIVVLGGVFVLDRSGNMRLKATPIDKPLGWADFNGDGVKDAIVVNGYFCELGSEVDRRGETPELDVLGYVDGTKTSFRHGGWYTEGDFNPLQANGLRQESGTILCGPANVKPEFNERMANGYYRMIFDHGSVKKVKVDSRAGVVDLTIEVDKSFGSKLFDMKGFSYSTKNTYSYSAVRPVTEGRLE